MAGCRFLQKREFSMGYARLEFLQCLKLVIKTMCTSLVWLVFHRHYLILVKKKEKAKKRKRYNNLEAVYPEAIKDFFAKLVNS